MWRQDSRRVVRICLTLVACASWLTSGHEGQAAPPAKDAKVFRAGASTSNVTPPLGEKIVGNWVPAPAKSVHDELHARCLVLDDGTTRLAIVLCDNVGIPREVFDAAKQKAHEQTGLPIDRMLMAATHTHSATSLRSENRLVPAKEFTPYQAFVIQRIADGVSRAISNLEPARIAWGQVDVPGQVFNRRWHMVPGYKLPDPFGGIDKVRMNPPRGSGELLRPAGPTDPQVSFISVQSAKGRPLALLANYSLHYVGGVRSNEISADYFAVFANRIEELLKAEKQTPPFVGIMSNGTSGDINNINFREKSPRRAPYEKMREVAEEVAQAVYKAHQKVEFQDWVPLAMAQKELTLKVRRPTPEQLAYANKILAKPENAPKYHVHERICADRVVKLSVSPETVSAIVQAVRIGDLGIATGPFELFAEIGLELKEKSPSQESFTIELANGWYGYLPTPAQHELGGYETWMGVNLVEKQASVKLLETQLRLLNQLFKPAAK